MAKRMKKTEEDSPRGRKEYKDSATSRNKAKKKYRGQGR